MVAKERVFLYVYKRARLYCMRLMQRLVARRAMFNKSELNYEKQVNNGQS